MESGSQSPTLHPTPDSSVAGRPSLISASVEFDSGPALRHEAWLREQYLRDLEVIERCECQVLEKAGCPDFFGCMGAIAAARGGSA